jgi:ABC-type nitrate/sulfonate/bicarbonate transport system permease component
MDDEPLQHTIGSCRSVFLGLAFGVAVGVGFVVTCRILLGPGL